MEIFSFGRWCSLCISEALKAFVEERAAKNRAMQDFWNSRMEMDGSMADVRRNGHLGDCMDGRTDG